MENGKISIARQFKEKALNFVQKEIFANILPLSKLIHFQFYYILVPQSNFALES
jgi:hypothetical protein